MARPRTTRRRRADIVEAARRALLQHGTAVRLNQIAEEAGVTSSAVLYHYPDIRDLLLDANRAGLERFYDERLRALDGIEDPAERLLTTIRAGLPVDSDDEDVRLLCELGGSGARSAVYGALLTALYDRQVAMYEVVLESGATRGEFTLAQPARTIARNLVALEDAYGYRMMARHPTIDHDVAVDLIADYARLATGHPLPLTPAADAIPSAVRSPTEHPTGRQDE